MEGPVWNQLHQKDVNKGVIMDFLQPSKLYKRFFWQPTEVQDLIVNICDKLNSIIHIVPFLKFYHHYMLLLQSE